MTATLSAIMLVGLAWWGTWLYAIAQLITTSYKTVYAQRAWIFLPSFLIALTSKYHHLHLAKKIGTELASIIIFGAVIILVPREYLLAYSFLLSALIIATITDLGSLIISRFTSLFLVPVAWFCAFWHLIPISTLASIAGSCLGYGILYLTAYAFARIMKKEGLGQGDSDLLALIGAFTGITGAWFSLFIGSLIGSLVGLALLATHKIDRATHLPFGPFLALGAFVYILYFFSGLQFIWLC